MAKKCWNNAGTKIHKYKYKYKYKYTNTNTNTNTYTNTILKYIYKYKYIYIIYNLCKFRLGVNIYTVLFQKLNQIRTGIGIIFLYENHTDKNTNTIIEI